MKVERFRWIPRSCTTGAEHFTPDDTLRDYLLDGHSEGRWHYTEQGDYNRYIVNDRVYDRFEDIALAYSR